MRYDLVFEGGGAKGMALVGAYAEFARRGHSFGRLLGTSAGAITAALLAAGYAPKELFDALNERENGAPIFAGFMGVPAPFTQQEIHNSEIRTLLRDINVKMVPDLVEDQFDDATARVLAQNPRSRHLFALVERGGWYGADRFVDWLKTRLDSGPWKGGRRKFSHMTLSQFHTETQVALSVVASDTTDGRLLVLNHHTAPDCPLVWAVRMSMSIPLMWNEVIWDTEWGTYQGRTLTTHTIVDGGLLSNFPIELFISSEPQVTRLMGAKQDTPVLGLLIDETLDVPSPAGARDAAVVPSAKLGELGIVQRLLRLVNTATGAHDKMVIDEFSHLVVRLPCRGYGTAEFGMSVQQRDALVEAGRNAMCVYLDQPPAAPPVSKGMSDIEAGRAKRIADRVATSLLEL